MKRILCVISCMNAGGAETFLMKLYRNIDRTKYQMDFCVNTKNNFYANEIEQLGGKIFYIPAKSESLVGFKKGLTELIQNERYKHILRITSNAMGFMDLKIAKKAGAEVCIARSSNASDGGGMASYVAHRVGKILYKKYVDVKIAPSDLAAKYTFGKRAYEKGEVAILHNAIDLSIFRYSQEGRKAIRRELGVADDELLLGHIGRFEAQKNHCFLLDIFKAITDRSPKTKLVLVGKGSLEDNIKYKAQRLGILDNIIFVGVRKDIPELLSAMDRFVFPSLYEGMPNTVIEAQSTGLPCIIADTITQEANITGLVEYLPLNGDVDVWAKHVMAAVATPRRDTKAEFIKNSYDIESAVSEFTSLIFGEKSE